MKSTRNHRKTLSAEGDCLVVRIAVKMFRLIVRSFVPGE